MKRMLPLFAAASLAALAACQKAGPTPPSHANRAAEAAAPSTAPADARRADAAPAAAFAPAQPAAKPAATVQSDDAPQPFPSSNYQPPTPREPMLAMTYRIGLVLPPEQVRPLMESHQEACERAGPLQCQVLGAELRSEGHDNQNASLNLRATPAWMRAFRGRAEADVKDAHGRIRDAMTTGEDLAQPIGDSQAAQRALEAQKVRLQELLDRRARHLDDSLEVEQEITRVQQAIDAQASSLEAMQNRVAMQTLTVDYTSSALAFDGDTAPLARASHHFGRNMLAVFAALIEIASYLAPFALIGAPIAWLLRKRWQAKPAARQAPTAQQG